jgi:hypothetical protein
MMAGAWAAAQAGLAQGEGPFWDPSQLCGRPLFGLSGLPWSSPLAPLALQAGPWALGLLAALGAVLLAARGGARRGWLWAFLGAAPLLWMPLGFQAGLVFAPVALLAFWAAPFFVAAVALALLISTLSPALGVAVAVLAWMRGPDAKAWSWRWAAGLALAAPAWLPLLRHSSMALEWDRAWPLAPPSEWGAALAWGACTLLADQAPKARIWMILALVGLSASLAPVLSTALFKAPAVQAALPYNQAHTRYLEAEGKSGSLDTLARSLDPQASLVGSLDGKGSLSSLRRWRSLAHGGAQAADLASLSDVGWIDSPGGGSLWQRAVAAAMVYGAAQDTTPHDPLRSLFERPLQVQGPVPAAPSGGAWNILNSDSVPGAATVLALPGGHPDAWVFLSQSFDPGWRAQALDAKGARRPLGIRVSEGGFMAVEAPSDVAVVEFQYRPPLFLWGILASLTVLVFLAWKDRVFRAQAR